MRHVTPHSIFVEVPFQVCSDNALQFCYGGSRRGSSAYAARQRWATSDEQTVLVLLRNDPILHVSAPQFDPEACRATRTTLLNLRVVRNTIRDRPPVAATTAAVVMAASRVVSHLVRTESTWVHSAD